MVERVVSVPTGTSDEQADGRRSHEHTDASPVIATISRRSLWGSLVSRTLPRYTGPYKVGVTECVHPRAPSRSFEPKRAHAAESVQTSIELPVETKGQSFGTFVHRKLPDSASGLAFETVLFTLFYPAAPPAQDGAIAKAERKEKVVWFPK